MFEWEIFSQFVAHFSSLLEHPVVKGSFIKIVKFKMLWVLNIIKNKNILIPFFLMKLNSKLTKN